MARKFTNLTDEVNFGSFALSVPCTVMVWVNPSIGLAHLDFIMGQDNQTDINYWSIRGTPAGGVELIIQFDGAVFAYGSYDAPITPINEWSFIAATVTNTEINLFKGTTADDLVQLVTTGDPPTGQTYTPTIIPLRLGKNDIDQRFKGAIDHSAIVNRVLTLEEIGSVLEKGFQGTPGTGTLSYMPNEGRYDPEVEYIADALAGIVTGTEVVTGNPFSKFVIGYVDGEDTDTGYTIGYVDNGIAGLPPNYANNFI